MFKKEWGDFSYLNVIFWWSLSLNQLPEREKRRASLCKKKAAGQPCPLARSRPRSLNCGVKTPTPRGDEPQVSAQGSEDVHHQGGGGGGGRRGAHSRTGAGFLPCWTGRGRGGAERKKRPGVKPGEGPTGPRKWASARPKSGVLGGIGRREGLAPCGRALVPRNPSGGWGGDGLWSPKPPCRARRPLTCQ